VKKELKDHNCTGAELLAQWNHRKSNKKGGKSKDMDLVHKNLEAMMNKAPKKVDYFDTPTDAKEDPKKNKMADVATTVNQVRKAENKLKADDSKTKSNQVVKSDLKNTAKGVIAKDQLTKKETPAPAPVKTNPTPSKVIEVKQPNNKISPDSKPPIPKPNDSKKPALGDTKPTVPESKVAVGNMVWKSFFYKLNYYCL
jgi:hypothetical protein